MKKDWVLTGESFDLLLAWLDSDRELAGEKYEQIRRGLIKIFVCRGCRDAEDLADETINRVSSRLNEIEPNFIGKFEEKVRYFYGVAKKVQLESQRTKPSPPPPLPQQDTIEIEREYDCLEKCMQQLPPGNRELVLNYYHEEKRAKIDHRRKLAEQLGIAVNALRIRAHRIRHALEECVRNCVSEATA